MSYALLALGLLTVFALGELGIRLWPDLPPPILWPSVEMEIKHSQLEGGEFEVLFLGTSITEAAVDPELIGFDSYNSALPFSSPVSLEVWYRLHFGDESPALVVLGMPAWSANDSSATDPLISGLLPVLDGGQHASHSALWRHKGLLADWHERITQARTIHSGLITDRGHQTAYYDIEGASIAARFGPVGVPEVGSDVREAVSALATRVKKRGDQFVIMVEPGRHPQNPAPEVVEAYMSSLGQLASDLEVSLWDTYSEEWPAIYFADEAHFNQAGTVAFSRYLRPLVEEALVGNS